MGLHLLGAMLRCHCCEWHWVVHDWRLLWSPNWVESVLQRQHQVLHADPDPDFEYKVTLIP